MLILSQLLTLTYALVVIAGGVIGFIYARSIPSIAMGSLFGVSLVVSAIFWLKKFPLASFVAIGLTLFLFAFFLLRFSLSGVFFPSGFMALISMGVFCVQYFEKRASTVQFAKQKTAK